MLTSITSVTLLPMTLNYKLHYILYFREEYERESKQSALGPLAFSGSKYYENIKVRKPRGLL